MDLGSFAGRYPYGGGCDLSGYIDQNIRRLGPGPQTGAGARAAPTGFDWGDLLGRGVAPAITKPSPEFGGISGYPATGRTPVSSGGFIMDLRNNTISGVALPQEQIFTGFNIGTDVQGLFNSVVMLADDDVTVTLHPGYQSWHADSCTIYAIPIKGLAYMSAVGSRSFVFQLIFSAQDEPIQPNPVTYHQERWATQTLTKTAIAGVADGWTSISFAASDGTDQLDPALFGDTSIHVGSMGAKNFITTTIGNDINLLFEGLGVSGKTWAADPMTGSSGVTLADGDVSNAQTARYYHVIRLRARVDAAVAAAGTSVITSQYRGMAGAF